MSETEMTLERFRELAEAYGADLERFPDGERNRARALLESSAEARALATSEAGLDRELSALAAPELPEALERRLVAIPGDLAQRRHFGRAWQGAALAWGAAAALGLFIGWESPDSEATATATGDAAAVEADDAARAEAEPADATLLGAPLADDEEATLALALGEFSELEEVP